MPREALSSRLRRGGTRPSHKKAIAPSALLLGAIHCACSAPDARTRCCATPLIKRPRRWCDRGLTTLPRTVQNKAGCRTLNPDSASRFLPSTSQPGRDENRLERRRAGRCHGGRQVVTPRVVLISRLLNGPHSQRIVGDGAGCQLGCTAAPRFYFAGLLPERQPRRCAPASGWSSRDSGLPRHPDSRYRHIRGQAAGG